MREDYHHGLIYWIFFSEELDILLLDIASHEF